MAGVFINKETEKMEQRRQLERMAIEDNKTINYYSSMNPENMTFKYDSKKTIQRNYRDFEIYKSMNADAAHSYGKFQKNIDFINVSREYTGTVLLGEVGENSLEIDKVIMNLCSNRLLDTTVEVNDMRILTEHLMAGALHKKDNPNETVCQTLKQEGIKALSEIYFRELDALSNKYGLNSLIKMSPLDYIMALPEIMYDFACIKDMQKFFGIYNEFATENPKMMKMLDFYAESWEQLQNRYMLIMNGEYKGEKYEEYSRKMKLAHNDAKDRKLFDKNNKRQPKEISRFWETAQQRKNMAASAIDKYNEAVKQDQIAYDKAQKKANEYLVNVDKINKNAGQVIIDEADVKIRIDEIMEETTYHMEEITEENVARIANNIFVRIEELCHTVSTCSDDILLSRYKDLRVEKEQIDSEITNMLCTHLFVRIREANPDDTQILPIKSRIAGISENYPLFGKVVSIMNNRIKLIQKYGYTNSAELTDVHDITGARFDATEKYKRASGGNIPMSIHDALNLPLFKNRLMDLEKIDFRVINEELAACKKVADFRSKEPNFYELGLSYDKHRRAEAMCELLPYYERAYELTLRYIGLKNNDSSVNSNLKAEWQEALKLYDRKSYRVDNSITDATYKADEMYSYLERNSELTENTDIWPEGTEEWKKIQISEAYAFISDGSTEVMKKEIEELFQVAEYQKQISGNSENVAITPEQFKAFSVQADKFFRLVTYLDKELDNADYEDYKFFQLRSDVYLAGYQARYLEMFFGKEKVKNELLEMCTGQYEKLKDDFENSNETINRILIYVDYTKALNIEYALNNKIEQMWVEDDGGVGTFDKLYLKRTVGSYKVNSGAKIHKIRANKLSRDKSQEIERQQREARVRKAVGHEKIASDTKTFMANIKEAHDWMSLGGNVIGTVTQFLSWRLHEPRTGHGVVNYDQCQKKYDEMMQTLGAGHAMRTSTLPMWQRGDAGISPEVDLDSLYGSQMKKDIYGLLNNEDNHDLLQPVEHDIMNNEFMGAIKAIKQYSTLVGIVNTDVTEMEMSFLDMFLKRTENYVSTNINSEDEVIIGRCNLLSQIKSILNEKLNGTLSATISEEELTQIEEKTMSYVESTIYSENMEESNIKDIPLFLHEPNINDVKQSSIGDCWLVAAIGAVVRTNPEYIRSMFHDTGDGNVIVRLYGIEKDGKVINSDRNVLYDKNVKIFPTYFKLRKQYETGWGNASDCTWVQLLEKAYALSGFNGRREMAIKGNKLYNVADELTYGNQGIALMHITGKHPEVLDKDPCVKIDEQEMAFYSVDFLAAVYDGFSRNEITIACEPIFSSYLPGNTIEKLRMYMEVTGAENCSERIDRNLRNIKNGVRTRSFAGTKELIEELRSRRRTVGKITFKEENSVRTVRDLADYFSEKRNENYAPNENLFYLRCRKAFESGKTISIAIPHCVDILDARETEQGKRFLLMRDPFNIYNYKYSGTVDNMETENEGFLTVFSGNKENRFLTGNAQDIINYGFRGTSWVELKDLFARVTGGYIPRFE